MGEHDSGYKLLFSSPELIRDLIQGFIPDDWLRGLDYGTLEKISNHYIADDQRQRTADVVWRVQVDGEWVYLYLLIEFQSTVDPHMAIRVMTSVGLLYQDLIRRHDLLPEQRLPPVLPLVLYNGEARWTAATDVAQLIPALPGHLARFQPRLAYWLIDESVYSEADLAPMRNLMAAVMRFEHAEAPERLIQLIGDLNDWLAGQPALKHTFAVWIRAILQRHSRRQLILPQVNDLQELKMSLAQRIEQWARDYQQQGLEQGISQGQARVLQRQLTRRFGLLPDSIQARLEAAASDELETWLDRILEAKTLDEVFRP